MRSCHQALTAEDWSDMVTTVGRPVGLQLMMNSGGPKELHGR